MDLQQFDVLYVDRAAVSHLATGDDPAATLRGQVPSPFHDWDALIHMNTAVAVTVVNLLPDPVEGVGAYLPAGTLKGTPQIRDASGSPVRPPSLEQALGGDHGFGWVDPPPMDDLVSVGSWVARQTDTVFASTSVSFVVHLRTDPGVDILVGGQSNYRPLGHIGPYSPYNVALYNPKTFPASPTESDYDAFFQNFVLNNGTWDDKEGASADKKVHYLSRAPQGRQDPLWHILLLLGPKPVKDNWDAFVAAGPALAAATAQHGVDVDTAVRRLLAVNAALEPAAAVGAQINAVTAGLPVDVLVDVLAEYQRRLQAIDDLVTRFLAVSTSARDPAALPRLHEAAAGAPPALVALAFTEYGKRLQALAHPGG